MMRLSQISLAEAMRSALVMRGLPLLACAVAFGMPGGSARAQQATPPASPPVNPPGETTSGTQTVTVTTPVVDVSVPIATNNSYAAYKAGVGPYPGGFADPKIAALRRELQRPIDIKLQDATVRQMAETLKSVTGMPVRIDDSVSSETRATVEAHAVPMALILEAVARRANLQINPGPGGNGVVLTRPPFLRVDGGTTNYGMSTWGEAWGIPPTASQHPGGLGGGGVITGFGLVQDYDSWDRDRRYQDYLANNGSNSRNAVATNLFLPNPAVPLSFTPLGNDRLIVSEGARGSNGEAGVLLTIYHIEGNGEMKRLGSTFHPLAPLATEKPAASNALPAPQPVGGAPTGH